MLENILERSTYVREFSVVKRSPLSLLDSYIHENAYDKFKNTLPQKLEG